VAIATDLRAQWQSYRAGLAEKEWAMRKFRETSADRIWKETLDSCATRPEAIVLAVLLVVLATGLLITNTYGLDHLS
jgi:hypothetical protein